MKVKAYSEFGYILWYFLPKAYYLHKKNKLESTDTRIGMRDVFYFSENHTEQNIVHDPPSFIRNPYSCYDIKPPEFTSDSWLPPPLKEKYKNDRFIFDKPIVTINNKNSLEWFGSGIYNYFNYESLDNIIKTLKDRYTVVYIRPPNKSTNTYVGDPNQTVVDIKDEEIIKKHGVVSITQLLEENKDLSYNQLQFMLLANSDKHISSAGEAVIPAYFGGETLIYTCPNCRAANRGVWKTGSWMSMLSGSKIIGYNDYDSIVNYIEKNW
jgi:hypothetical protein